MPVDEIKKDIAEIKVICQETQELANANNLEQKLIRKDLEYHIERTDLLEESHQELQKEFKPVKMHVAVFSAVVKALLVGLGAIATIVGIVAGIIKLL